MKRLLFASLLVAIHLAGQSRAVPPLADAQQIELEKARMSLDQERTKLESTRTVWTAVASGIPILAVIGTVFYGVWSVKRTVETQTMTKLAELALEGHVPDAMASRARLLAHMLRKSLPKDFERTVADFQAGSLKTDTAPAEFIQIRVGMVKLRAEFPSQRQQILTDLLVYFPGDAKFIRALR